MFGQMVRQQSEHEKAVKPGPSVGAYDALNTYFPAWSTKFFTKPTNKHIFPSIPNILCSLMFIFTILVSLNFGKAQIYFPNPALPTLEIRSLLKNSISQSQPQWRLAFWQIQKQDDLFLLSCRTFFQTCFHDWLTNNPVMTWGQNSLELWPVTTNVCQCLHLVFRWSHLKEELR